jgi:hypothetical protein
MNEALTLYSFNFSFYILVWTLYTKANTHTIYFRRLWFFYIMSHVILQFNHLMIQSLLFNSVNIVAFKLNHYH